MDQKYILITGASRGLGESLTRFFWDKGYNVCLIARNKNNLEKLAVSLPAKSNQNYLLISADLGKPRSVNRAIKQIQKSWSRLDVLINNAAIQGPIGPIEDNGFSKWQETIQINLLAPVSLCQAFIPGMKAQGSGSIINLSGGGATGPRANFSAYASAKAGLVRFSETVAEETKGFGIKVNCVAPGAMKTNMLGEVLKKGPKLSGEREFAIASKVFEEGGASLDRVAELAFFLASEKSKGITGRLISAVWDDWGHWQEHLQELSSSDAYTLRRITGRDRGLTWGDK